MAAAAPGAASSVFLAIRRLAQEMNAHRDFSSVRAEPVRAGQLMTLGVIEDVLRFIADRYCFEEHPQSLDQGLDRVQDQEGHWYVDQPVRSFVHLFPPSSLRAGEVSVERFLQATRPGPSNQHLTVRELILLALAVSNRALRPFLDLFDDAELRQRSPYVPLVHALENFYSTMPPLQALGQRLFEMLRAPMQASPDSLEGQLDYIRKNWAHLLPSGLFQRLLVAGDMLKEENLLRGAGPGSVTALRFGREAAAELDLPYAEYDRFTADKDWMSNVVLIAKSVYVWLDQLSKWYQRPIRRLDEIPDEELDRLARWGINGLWLIGVWERSPASQEIKQRMGNPEAAPSAYSIFEYRIADELGGDAACDNLRERAWRRGIRLASDMVPNHTGLYSKWIIEHPEWFIQLDYPPYPNYRFSGLDFSRDPSIGLFIEDGYWDRRDAAVVFQRVDKNSGHVRYIYHGNDGTNMPWNDTAQLNYLLPQAREAVIQTILYVARRFPILRFDAAMTLTKRHYQRLWFPKPGDGGAIPSRAEHGMSRAEFEKAMPEEFWREVVDRVNAQAPDTLLLAEAFWLLEGYFVRTLGMHRVYNSAFMNMLKMEENSKYRATVRNVLEFSPEVLKRFVNFMNNPDELTAVEQFGKGDKYLGVVLLMVTMPGLPMFGHGQIEGFTEKYGMEYRRAYWDEHPDHDLIRRHEAEIFPLLHKRYLFSGVEHFAFYDFVTPDGRVNEDVFSYSNRAGGERALILYNNAYRSTAGCVCLSTTINVGKPEAGPYVRRTLAEALALRGDEHCFYVFRDHHDGLEYLRSGNQLVHEGLYVELHAYHYHVFLDFREVEDHDGTWAGLAARLHGRGVPNMEEAYRETLLAPVLDGFNILFNSDRLKKLTDVMSGKLAPKTVTPEVVTSVQIFLERMEQWLEHPVDRERFIQMSRETLDAVWKFDARFTAKVPDEHLRRFLQSWAPQAAPDETPTEPRAAIAVTWALTRPLGIVQSAPDIEFVSALALEEWMLGRVITRVFSEAGRDWWSAAMDTVLIKTLLRYRSLGLLEAASAPAAVLRRLFDDPAVREFLLFNHHDGILWYNKEQFERLLYWFHFVAAVCDETDARLSDPERGRRAKSRLNRLDEILAAAEAAGYRAENTATLLT
ncbi:MAG: alpha-amylase [Candidatus Hydrogenedentes bacterium]|nr:alpha-amylase [Candidatus Hydrogenedentota bacterium]